MQLDPQEVLREVQQINPMVVDLAMERVAHRKTLQEVEELKALLKDKDPDKAPEEDGVTTTLREVE